MKICHHRECSKKYPFHFSKDGSKKKSVEETDQSCHWSGKLFRKLYLWFVTSYVIHCWESWNFRCLVLILLLWVCVSLLFKVPLLKYILLALLAAVVLKLRQMHLSICNIIILNRPLIFFCPFNPLPRNFR